MSNAASPRRGLGRGFEVLIGGAASVELAHVPIEQIHANPRQPRRRFDHSSTAGLADSIRLQGIVQPVVLRPRLEGGYELIAGERRWRAAREAGLPDRARADPRGRRPRHAPPRARRERREREPLPGRGGARIRGADGRVRAVARRGLASGSVARSRRSPTSCGSSSSPTTCSRWSSAASSPRGTPGRSSPFPTTPSGGGSRGRSSRRGCPCGRPSVRHAGRARRRSRARRRRSIPRSRGA